MKLQSFANFRKMKHTKKLIYIAIFLIAMAFIYFIYLYSTRMEIINIEFCSDVCPDNKSTYRVYKGINNEKECKSVGGNAIIDPAWGGFIGCAPN